VRPGCCAAVPISNPERGIEEMVLVCETRIEEAKQRAGLREEIRARVLDAIAAAPDVVMLVAPGTVLKTSSGKIRRQEMRERYLRGDLRPEHLSRLLRLRLFAEAVRERLRRLISA
jgi:acyl-CoA synthetase (AMP-forming)/AMP-acid ligase II